MDDQMHYDEPNAAHALVNTMKSGNGHNEYAKYHLGRFVVISNGNCVTRNMETNIDTHATLLKLCENGLDHTLHSLCFCLVFWGSDLGIERLQKRKDPD